MKSSRRVFIRNSALAATGAAIFSGTGFAIPRASKMLGLQLYTVRDDMKKDPLNTLKQLSAIGYKHVEHANYVKRKFYGYSAAEFKKIINDLGMDMPSGHTSMGPQHWDAAKNDFTDEWKWTVEDAATAGQQYVISPWLDESLRKTTDDLLRFLDVFNKCGELCKKSGMKFGYHNHNFELTVVLDNKKLFDIILDRTDPSLVAQQLDIGNMYGAGGRAADLISRYPGRFELMHVKDEIKTDKKGEMDDGYESTVLGAGVMDVKTVLDLAQKSGGTKWFIIEQESYQGKTPVQCSKEDHDAMVKWGYNG